MPDARPELAEFVGTFALVFVGCGAIAAGSVGSFSGPVGVAIAFGFTIMAMVYALGHVSGAHFNPAVTAAFTASGHFPLKRAFTYVIAQVAGAAAAAFLLVAVFPEHADIGVTRPAVGFTGAAFVFEVAVTAFLMLTILSVATDSRASPAAAGLAIGSVIVVGAIAAGGVSGGSFNPARSIGPALAAREFGDLWIYLTAPFAGALLGAVLYETIRGGSSTPQRLGPREALGALGRIRLRDAPRPNATLEPVTAEEGREPPAVGGRP